MRARSNDVTEQPTRLSEIGITKMESSRFQKVASLPDAIFEHHIAP